MLANQRLDENLNCIKIINNKHDLSCFFLNDAFGVSPCCTPFGVIMIRFFLPTNQIHDLRKAFILF